MTEKILTCRFKRADPSIKLICFPWSGGGAAFYSNWGKHLPDSIEVHGVCLAGRENRFKDPMYSELSDLLDDVTAAIHEQCKNIPFAFFGHSFGSYLTYEAACLLKSRYNMEPSYMFVSATSAEHAEMRKKTKLDVKNMTLEQFKDIMRELGGTPPELLDDPEYIKYFIPAIRADYLLIGQLNEDHPSTRHVLSCPVDVFDGKDDKKHDLQSWNDITTGAFSITMFNGGHFYLKDQPNLDKILSYITCALEASPL